MKKLLAVVKDGDLAESVETGDFFHLHKLIAYHFRFCFYRIQKCIIHRVKHHAASCARYRIHSEC